MLPKSKFKEFIKFILAGGFAAFANIGSRIFFSIFFPYNLSIVFSFFVGLSSGFLLMRKYVFVFKRNLLKSQIIRFTFINILNLFQTFFIAYSLKFLLGMMVNNIKIIELLAHIGGVSFPIITSYFAHKYFTFR